VHEFSLVQALLEQVAAEVQNAGHAGPVQAIDLAVGRLSGVHVDSLRFAFELLAPESIAAGAVLRIAQPAAAVQCCGCGRATDITELVMHCPQCGSDCITITGGQDLLLQSIELADESPPD
jgi:hydrogenase nickel incorporation protein HypA/HybF